MKNRSKFSQDQNHAEQQSAAQESRQETHEFASAEEVIRFEAGQTVVPPEVAERLKRSLAGEAPAPRRSWWRNLFGQ